MLKESQREAKPLLKTDSPSPLKERGTKRVRLINFMGVSTIEL